jgi:hypothetical protein
MGLGYILGGFCNKNAPDHTAAERMLKIKLEKNSRSVKLLD